MNKDRQSRTTLRMLDAVRQIFVAETAHNMKASQTLGRVLASFPDLKMDPKQVEAKQLPVCEHLSRALDLGAVGTAAPVAASIRQIESTLVWEQSTNHSEELRGAHFMDNYAYSSLGLTGSDTLYVGLLLLGPGITYPLTSYPSEGVFLVIGGSPEWISGEDDWRQVHAGDIIHRPKGGAEGKRPGTEPMLALYAWIYD